MVTEQQCRRQVGAGFLDLLPADVRDDVRDIFLAAVKQCDLDAADIVCRVRLAAMHACTRAALERDDRAMERALAVKRAVDEAFRTHLDEAKTYAAVLVWGGK